MKKGGGFCEMMRGCSVREMAARGAWVCLQIWERFCVCFFFWMGLGVLKLKGIRPGLGER